MLVRMLEKGTLIRNVALCSHYGNQYGGFSKNYNRAGRVTQTVKCLPSKCEVLSLNPSTITHTHTKKTLK
jgi:hypothetical protein